MNGKMNLVCLIVMLLLDSVSSFWGWRPSTFGQWGTWNSWSKCSSNCGAGFQSRSRQCSKTTCIGGLPYEFKPCSGTCCEAYLQWSQWESCHTGSSSSRHRECCDSSLSCTSNPAQDLVQVKICPVHGGWANWQAWSKCSVNCGKGEQTRVRECTQPAPNYGGNTCSGSSTDKQACDGKYCNGEPQGQTSPVACSTTTTTYSNYQCCPMVDWCKNLYPGQWFCWTWTYDVTNKQC